MDKVYFQNTVQDYLIALGIILLGSLFILLFKKRVFIKIQEWSNRTQTRFDDFLVDALERFGIPAAHFTVIYIGLNFLSLSRAGSNLVKIATTVVLTFLFIRLFSSVILMLLKSYVRRQHRGEEKVKQLAGLILIINGVIWIIGLLFLFDNLGYDVTAMVTGLGIGGIAIALAAQNILGDLFNYFVIFFDRPFEVDDFIIIGDKMGTVEHIGIKTTRLKSLTGEQLILANSDLTSSRIHNYKRMERRRILFSIGVVYDTTPENIKQIPDIIKAAIEEQSLVQFDRAHFLNFGDSSLNFEVVYFVLSSDYNTYMDTQQAINLRIYEEFTEKGIEFAYPTSTLYLKRTQQAESQSVNGMQGMENS